MKPLRLALMFSTELYAIFLVLKSGSFRKMKFIMTPAILSHLCIPLQFGICLYDSHIRCAARQQQNKGEVIFKFLLFLHLNFHCILWKLNVNGNWCIHRGLLSEAVVVIGQCPMSRYVTIPKTIWNSVLRCYESVLWQLHGTSMADKRCRSRLWPVEAIMLSHSKPVSRLVCTSKAEVRVAFVQCSGYQGHEDKI